MEKWYFSKKNQEKLKLSEKKCWHSFWFM